MSLLWRLASRAGPAALLAMVLHLYLQRRQAAKEKAARALTMNLPGTLGSYWLGETLAFAAAMREFERERFARYGNAFYTHVAGKNVVFVADRASADFVYKAPETLIQAGTFDTFQALMKDSVLLMTGRDHRQSRLQITKVLSDAQLDANLRVLQDVFGDKLRAWRGPVEMHSALKDVLFTGACRVLFGLDAELFGTVVRTLKDLSAVYGKGFFALPVDLGDYSEFGRALQAREQLVLFIRELAVRRRSQPDMYKQGAPDLLQLLLDLRNEDGGVDDVDRVASNAQTLLFGATDTTASLVAHALLRLHENPAVLDRVRAEFQSTLGTGPLPAATLQALKLPFVDAVLRECLRLRPPFASGTWRTAVADVTLPSGYVVPRGWMISVAMDFPQNHDAEAFPEPDAFYPNRFLPTGSSAAHADFDGALNPFGRGAHGCPGKGFALAEAKLLLALIVLRPNKAFPRLVAVPQKWCDKPAHEAAEGMEMIF